GPRGIRWSPSPGDGGHNSAARLQLNDQHQSARRRRAGGGPAIAGRTASLTTPAPSAVVSRHQRRVGHSRNSSRQGPVSGRSRKRGRGGGRKGDRAGPEGVLP